MEMFLFFLLCGGVGFYFYSKSTSNETLIAKYTDEFTNKYGLNSLKSELESLERTYKDEDTNLKSLLESEKYKEINIILNEIDYLEEDKAELEDEIESLRRIIGE